MKTLFLGLALFYLDSYAITTESQGLERYDYFQVLKVKVPNEESVSFILNNLQSLVDIWSEPRIGYYSDIMVSADKLEIAHYMLTQANMEYSVIIENVQIIMELENISEYNVDLVPETSVHPHPMKWFDYYSKDDVNEYMDDLVNKYPGDVSTEDLEQSYEDSRIITVRNDAMAFHDAIDQHIPNPNATTSTTAIPIITTISTFTGTSAPIKTENMIWLYVVLLLIMLCMLIFFMCFGTNSNN